MYKISLDLVGVGYKVAQIKNGVSINYGFSHPINFFVLAKDINSVNVTSPKSDNIIVESADKELAGQYASKILKLRKYDIYKGKGMSITGVKMLTKKRKVKK